MVENILFHLEEKKIIIIILHPSCLKINHCSIDLRSYVSLEGERAYAVFVSLLRRVSPSWGGGEEPALILAFSLVNPPMPQDKFPIGHDWCFSHKHFSLIVHGLISLHIRFGEAGGIWEGAAVSRYHLRSLNGLLHIFSRSLQDFTPCGACAAIDQMQQLRARGCGFLYPFLFTVVLCMVGLE